MTRKFLGQLVADAAAPYRSVGQAAWHFARGKLGGDPVFAGLLRHGLIPPQARVLDIGCGQGLLTTALLSAKRLSDAGNWPATWPAAPDPVSIRGIELRQGKVDSARRAHQNRTDLPQVDFDVADMCRADFGAVDAVVILDVLHYVNAAAQDDILRRVRDALLPGGILILRVGDAQGGMAFRWSIWVDYAVTFLSGYGTGKMYHRPLSAWRDALCALGFDVDSLPMNEGTPFANVLLLGSLPAVPCTATPVLLQSVPKHATTPLF